MNAKNLIIKHEGLKLKPYKDTAGKLTIGVGRNLDDNGIAYEEAMILLENDINRTKKELAKIFDDFDALPYNVKLVLIDMLFNLGLPKFLKFKNMIQSVKERDWKKMIYEMENSLWCKQVKTRCRDNIELIKGVTNEA